MRNVILFSTSLSINSKSFLLAKYLNELLIDLKIDVTLIDLRLLNLPECSRTNTDDNPEVTKIKLLLHNTTHIVFAVPIYNYDVGSSAKNLMELLSDKELNDKIIACLSG